MKTGAPDGDGDCAVAVTFARIAALSPPALPPGLSERIIRDVPRLAQLPAPTRLPIRGGLRAPPLVHIVASSQSQRASAGRRPIAGWSALAAGIAAIALMLPSAFPARPRVAVRHAAVVPLQQVALAQAAPVSRLAARVPVSHAIRAHFVAAPVARDSDEASAEPVAPPTPAVIAVAVAAPVGLQPSRPVYGPVDTEAQASTGTAGGIGSGPTAGYAFTGGAHP